MHDEKLLAVNARLYDRVRRIIGGIVAQGAKADRFRPVKAQQAGAVILGLVDGLSLQITFDPGAFTLTEAKRFCEDAVLRYFRREA